MAQRVAEGGHHVAAAFVEQRYYNSLSLLKTSYQVFDRLQLYDNSETEPEELVDFLAGTLLQRLRPLPHWAQTVAAHMERMEAIYARLPKK
ncbi:hypothetical protein QMK33_20040 [Hymenobacter sp. H14-R3]|uniref:hypothetical protein n=1 Tax=Hymenobacter sp. H14-R3 TaxID=3046308 RepID=UPI0024BB99EA|nr:hypothetical protein [Hymenobacter sp. H14-R3]MDJ0367446.1 hypothetical protein [Hymenobacter sp. H14-R3]